MEGMLTWAYKWRLALELFGLDVYLQQTISTIYGDQKIHWTHTRPFGTYVVVRATTDFGTRIVAP